MSITPTALTGLLVADTYTAPNGGPDSIPSPTEVNGQPVDAVLELQSTTRGLLVPRMTTIQRNALVADDGFIIYNLTTNEFNLYANGAWGSVGAGSVIGPGVSVAGDIAIFADNTGTVIADSGVPITQVPAPLTHLLRNSFLSTVNQIGNLGHVKFVNGVGLVFVDALMPVEFIDNNYGPGSQVCSLFTGDLPSSSTTPSCLVELQSTTGALVVSRMTTAERLALFATNGMMVYDTTANIFYVYQGGIWNPVDTSGGSVTQINEGTGITCSPNPIVGAGTISLTPTAVMAGTYTVMNGTVNAEGQLTAASSATVITDTTGTSQNLFIGIDTGVLGTTSVGNCAVGCNALLSNNQNGPLSSFNSAFGSFSLSSNSSGSNNSAFGYLSLGGNTSGGGNCAVGNGAMRFNTTGSNNCAVGDLALASASSGSNASSGSCALGYQALFNNSAGGLCAFGYQALYSNVSAIANSAFGYQALTANTSGASNNAFGSSALIANTVGANNSAFGPSSLFSNIGGSGNSALGSSTLSANINGNSNSAVGYNAGASQASYTNCSFFGAASDASVSGLTNSTAIGSGSSVATSNSLVLGSSCNVGINQSSPAYTLHISNVSSNCALKLDNTTSIPSSPAASAGGILYTSGDSLFYANHTITLNLSTGGATPNSATYILQTANASLANAQSLGALTTGLLKNTVTTGTGVLSTAVAGTDYYSLNNPTRIIDSVTNLNTFLGQTAGNLTLTGTQNCGFGDSCLSSLTNGTANTAIGALCMQSCTTGGDNCAVGNASLRNCTTGLGNTSVGVNALIQLVSGSGNCAFGLGSLDSVTSGGNNSGYGGNTLDQITSSSSNSAFGVSAGSSQTSYSSCTFLGYSADASVNGLTNAIAIGANSSVSASNSLVLGNGCNVGIGDSAPASTLSVVGSAQIGFSAGTASVSNGLVVSGNVGIGTNTPNAPLQFSNSFAGVNRILALYQSIGNNQHQFYGFGVNGGILRYQVDATTDSHVFYAAASSSSSNELFRITGGGSVGIGDSSPGSKLSVVGNAQIGFAAGTTATANGLAVSGNIGIGTSTAPVRLSLLGTDQNYANGPHIQCQTSADAYPQFQVLAWGHSNVSLNFDSYFNGSWISSSVQSNFQIQKTGAQFQVNYAAGVTAGSTITWNTGTILTSTGNFGIGVAPSAKLHVNGPIITAPPASSATTVALGTAYQNTLGYDVLITVYISVTVSAGGQVKSGVGPTNTPTQQVVFNGVTGTACVSCIVPNNYYLLISTTGTITAAIAGQQATAL